MLRDLTNNAVVYTQNRRAFVGYSTNGSSAATQAAETGQTAALITPDRMLTRQVSAALDRWNILPDDSAGLPLQLPASLANIDMEDLMMVDKKVKGGKLVLVLLKDIGDAVTTDNFDPALLAETIAHFQANTGPG